MVVSVNRQFKRWGLTQDRFQSANVQFEIWRKNGVLSSIFFVAGPRQKIIKNAFQFFK